MIMAKKGEVEATKLLLDNKAEVNIKDFIGLTALHQAIYKGHIEVARLLLKHGADPDKKDNYYQASPLFVAELLGKKRIKKLLLKHGASPLDESEKLKLNNNKLLTICRLLPKDKLLSMGSLQNMKLKKSFEYFHFLNL